MNNPRSRLVFRLLACLVAAPACSTDPAVDDAAGASSAAPVGGLTPPVVTGGPGGTGAVSPKAPPAPPSVGPAATCAPASTFSYAVCVCEDFHHAGQLVVGSGPSGAGSIGVNGKVSFADHLEVAGGVVAHGGFQAGTGAFIGGPLRSDADLTAAGAMWIGGDLVARRDFTGFGFLDLAGKLRVGGTDKYFGVRKIGGIAPAPARADAPCGCGAQAFDVAEAVALTRGSNDNAARGLPATGVTTIGYARTTFTPGRYYFGGDVRQIGRFKVRIEGAVQIYVDGDLTEVGYEDIEIVPGGSLDLYVAGAVKLVGYTPLGDEKNPSAFRLYVGGGGKLSVALGKQDFFGSIYAPNAEIHTAGDTQVVGALFARQLAAAGRLRVAHGGAQPAGCGRPKPATPPGASTPPPAVPAPSPGLIP